MNLKAIRKLAKKIINDYRDYLIDEGDALYFTGRDIANILGYYFGESPSYLKARLPVKVGVHITRTGLVWSDFYQGLWENEELAQTIDFIIDELVKEFKNTIQLKEVTYDA